MKLRIFDNNGKTADRYTVIIDDDVFTMSTDCNAPNGVNMYCCSAKHIDIEKIEIENKEIVFTAGLKFTAGIPFMAVDVAKWLDENS